MQDSLYTTMKTLADFAGHHITHPSREFLLTLLKQLIEEHDTEIQNNEDLHRHIDDMLQRESFESAQFDFIPQIDEEALTQRLKALTSGSPMQITRSILFLHQQLGTLSILGTPGVSDFLLMHLCPFKFSLPLGTGAVRAQDSKLVFISPPTCTFL